MDILRQRLHAQRLSRHDLATPAAVVRALGAVQCQDYAGGLWAIGARLAKGTREDVEQAISMREIVRTWPMRGTLHFVAPEDVRWMLEHLAARVQARAGSRHRQLGLDAATFAKARKVLEKALAGEVVTRPACMAALTNAGIAVTGQRGIHILGELALQGVLCCGPYVGKQPSFVLLEEFVPPAKKLARADALVELARRYFTSHGPATLKDFAWWTGLPMADARGALAAIEGELERDDVDGRTLYRAPGVAKSKVPAALLLPPWDEYTVAYVDRTGVLDARASKRTKPTDLLRPVVVLEGLVAGTWTRTLTRTPPKGGVRVDVKPMRALDSSEKRAIEGAAQRYAGFLGMELAKLVVA